MSHLLALLLTLLLPFQSFASVLAPLQAGNDLLISSVADEAQHVVQYSKKSTFKSTSYSKSTYDLVNQGSEINAGGTVNLVSGGDMGLVGSEVTSGEDTNIATGGTLLVGVAEDKHESHEEKKRSSGVLKLFDGFGILGFGSSEKTTHDTVQTAERGTELISGDALQTVSGGDTTLIGAQVQAGGEVHITSGGAVNLLAAKESDYESSTKSSTSLMWQSQEGKGHSSETNRLTTIETPQLIIDAQAINADVRTGVRASPEPGHIAEDRSPEQVSLNNTEGLNYLAQLQNDPRVQWNEVSDAYEEWDYKTQGLTPEGAALIAIATAVATGGAGSAISGTVSGAATSAGMGATAAAAAGTAAQGAFAALASQAAVTLANNKGDIGATLSDMGSSETVKNLAVAALSAGATSGLTSSLGVTGNAATSALNAASSATAQSIVNGENFGDTLVTQLQFAGANIVGTQIAGFVGDNFAGGSIGNNIAQAIGHALGGCLEGAIANGSCGGGAVGGVVGEFGAEFAHNSLGVTTLQAADIGKLMAAYSGVLVQDGAEGVTAAYQAGGTAIENNYLTHTHLEQWKEQVLASCKRDAECEKKKAREFLESQIAADMITNPNPALQGEFIYCNELCQLMVADMNGLQGTALLAMTVPGDAIALGAAGRNLITLAKTEGIIPPYLCPHMPPDVANFYETLME